MIHTVDLTGNYKTNIYKEARRLLSEGAHVSDTVVTVRNGVESMRGIVGQLAQWTVVERAATGPSLEPYRAFEGFDHE